MVPTEYLIRGVPILTFGLIHEGEEASQPQDDTEHSTGGD